MNGASQTTPSFATASSLGLPLSSHSKSYAASLPRGSACKVCRNRKVKCDGRKPACGACVKSATAHGDDPSLVICNFDEDERGEKRKRVSGSGKVQALEAKIAELEQIISQHQAQPLPLNDAALEYRPVASTSAVRHSSTVGGSGYSTPSRSNLDFLLQVTEQHAEASLFSSAHVSMDFTSPDASYDSTFLPNSTSFPTFPSLPLPLPYSPSPPLSPDPLLELFYPGWPRDLPSPLLTSRLIDVYFTKSHAASGMINQSKFLAAMTLPPTHSRFPHVGLIHAVLATASRCVGTSFFEREIKYWGGEGEETVTDYHAKRAKVAINFSISRGESLFQLAQACVLVCLWTFTAARFVEIWLYTGILMRLMAPLGLNHIRAVQMFADGTAGDRPPHMKANVRIISQVSLPGETLLSINPCAQLLPPTGDAEELYERAMTFWMGQSCNVFASASTGWASSMDERTFVREIAIKDAKGETSELEQLKTNVKTIILAMRAYRSPLGESTATSLQLLLDNPERCLPHVDLSVAGFGYGGICRPSELQSSLGCHLNQPDPTSVTSSKERIAEGGSTVQTSKMDAEFASIFSFEGMSPGDERFRELLEMGNVEGF
ncbi:hypothetical protein P7C70_g7877, partial [Phenoliferia sp. Uapishka_3]